MRIARFSYVIVTYNNVDTIAACLSSIQSYTADPYEIIVVDNSSDEWTAAAVKSFALAHSDVVIHLIETGSNLGFGRACNVGAATAAGDFLFFLNPDTQLLNDASHTLANCLLVNPGAVAAGPAILDAQGRLTRTCRNLPNVFRVLLDATRLDQWVGAYKLVRFDHESPRIVEQIIGAAILVRRLDYEKLGGMDERFFVYFEEVDLCKRLSEKGGRIWFWPEARVQHLAGLSCEVDPVRARMIYILRESRRKYFAKHFGTLQIAVLELINRFEGLEKAAMLFLLWLFRRKPSDWEKARGFWWVAMGSRPESLTR